jgi:hypothetical protein
VAEGQTLVRDRIPSGEVPAEVGHGREGCGDVNFKPRLLYDAPMQEEV